MAAATDQEFPETSLHNSECNEVCDDDTNKLAEPAPSKYMEVNDDIVKDVDIDGTIIMDADGNYYYQSSESVVEVKPLPKIPGQPVKKVPAVVVPQNKLKNEVKTFNNAKLQDETIVSEIDNEQKVFEFDENEQDADDPQDIIDNVYETKGIIKKSTKNSNSSEPVSFTCVVCPYETNKKFLLSRHLKTHSDDRPYKCDVCERGFKTKTALTNHRNIHLGRRPHACPSCDMAFTTSGELVRHVRYRHTHVKPHKCTECDYSSVELSKLRRHMRCHTGERPYQCPHCTYASPDTFKLKRHMRIHTGEKPYECDICHARFTQSNSLKHHRLIHSVSEKPVFQCHLCPTTCGRKTDLRLHIKNLHSSDQPLPCKRCGKELPDRYSYKMHIKTHEGEKCFRCKYCPYASISQRHLETHSLIHFNAKPFTCDICQFSFRQKQLLVRHTKIYHTNDYEPPKERKKDHKCPHCNKMFVFNGNLIRHMEIHDPTSRRIEERDKLKLGRLKRVKPDGTVVTIPPSKAFSDEFQDSEEFYFDYPEEGQQVEDEELQIVELEETEIYNEDNIQYVYEDYEDDEGLDDEEKNEEKQSEVNEKSRLMDIKQENLQTNYTEQVSLKNNIIVKDEYKTDAEILELEDQDDQDFMVIEVLPDDEDNDDQQQEEEKEQQVKSQPFKPTIISIKTNTSSAKNAQKSSQSLITNYFGFDVNEEKDEETKDAIQILEMIDQE